MVRVKEIATTTVGTSAGVWSAGDYGC